MRRAALAVAAALASTASLAAGTARAGDPDSAPAATTPAPAAGAEPADSRVVLLNAASRLGLGQIDRLRRVLDQRGLLAPLPQRLEAVLDGRNAVVSDLDAIREAYGRQDYTRARKLIDADEARLLANIAAGDPMPALAQLSQLHGLIAVAEDKNDDAIAWFRAAHRFNPAQAVEKQLASPRVRNLMNRARSEPAETGTLRIDADPEDARVAIDGGSPQSAGQRLELPIGVHLVQVSASGRQSYAELLEIHAARLEKLAISLDPETSQDRAARLVDATLAAPTSTARLKPVTGLSRLTGGHRMLVIEEGADDHVTVRVYDVDNRKVSAPVELAGSAPSEQIARKILAALAPENMTETSVMVIEHDHRPSWYQHWYVWAGAALLVGGGIATYELAGRQPTSIRGF